MSGSYRQMAPVYRAMMETRLHKAQDVYDAPEPTDVADLRFLSREASGKIALLTEATRKVMDLNQEWTQFLQKIKDPALRDQEDQIYERCVLSNEQGFMSSHLMEQSDELVGKLNERLTESRASLASQTAPASTGHAPGASLQRIHAKLPEIPIPDFRGDVLEWSEFWPIYEEIVHSRTDMSKTMKFSYLRPHLKGIAFDAIDGIPLTDAGYDTAICYLKERFDREKERLVSLLYAKMRNIPSSGERLTERRKTFDTCEKVFRLLENANQDLSGYHPLGLDFLAKFPKFAVRDLHKFHNVGPESTLPELRKAMKDLVSKEEVIEGFFEDTSPFRAEPEVEQRLQSENMVEKNFYRSDLRNNRRDENRSRSYSEQARSTFVALRCQTSSPPSRCYFCQANHFNSQCTKYSTSRERANRLRELDRCVRCARNHNARQPKDECTLPIRCFYCRIENDHYGALCTEQFPDDPYDSAQRTEQINESEEVQILPRQTTSGPQLSGLTAMATSPTCSLFQTAKVKAVGVDDQGHKHSCTVRLALDTMSTSSYILTPKARELHLQSQGSNTLLIKIFGSPKATEILTHQVQFALTKADGSLLHIDAAAVDFISDIDVLPNSWPEAERRLLAPFKNHDLADDIDDEDKTIDVLLGADYIWKIVEPEQPQIRFPNSDVVLIPSVFGYMLSGSMVCPESQVLTRRAMLCATVRDECQLDEISHARFSVMSDALTIDEGFKAEARGVLNCPVIDDDFSDLALSCSARYRFWRVSFGMIVTAFVGITLLFLLRTEFGKLPKQIEDDTFSDDVVSRVSDRYAVQYNHEPSLLFEQVGMNLQELCSNYVELARTISERDLVKSHDGKVIGLKCYNRGDDTLRTPNDAKRSVLQARASIFDPMKFFPPVAAPARLLSPQLWQIGSAWDTPTADEERNEACFCRRQETEGNVATPLIFAESLVSPIPKQKWKKGIKNPLTEQVSLPRLEHLGAVVAADAAEICRKTFKTPELRVYVLIDSERVLQWLRNDCAFKRRSKSKNNRTTTTIQDGTTPTSADDDDENVQSFSTKGIATIQYI